MKYICIGLIILLYSFQTLFCKLFSDKYPGKNELVSLVFCIIQSIFITLTTYIRCHFSSVFLWNSFSSRNCNCIENFRYLHDAYCTLIKMQTIYHNEEKQSMITFTLMGFTAFINLFKKEKGSTLQVFKLNKKCLPSLILCLISATLAINLLMYILPLIDTAILYTVQNGGVLILSALYSIFLFKEKISRQKILGIIIAVISITILSI